MTSPASASRAPLRCARRGRVSLFIDLSLSRARAALRRLQALNPAAPMASEYIRYDHAGLGNVGRR